MKYEKKLKKFNCKICGREINHSGNCLACNILRKKGSPIAWCDAKGHSNGKLRDKREDIDKLSDQWDFIKEIIDEDSYGDRILFRRHQKGNPMFRKYVFEKYGEKCFLCEKKKKRLQIHHESYTPNCKFFLSVRGKKYSRRISACAKCKKLDQESFNKCMSLVKPICWPCHRRIHIKLKKETGSWIPED